MSDFNSTVKNIQFFVCSTRKRKHIASTTNAKLRW